MEEEDSQEICSGQGSQTLPHPDLLVDHSVLCVLIKFFLRVNIDPVGSQLFPDLVKQNRALIGDKHLTFMMHIKDV